MLRGMSDGEINEADRLGFATHAGALALDLEQCTRYARESLERRAEFVREWRAAGYTQRKRAEALGVTPAVIATIDKRAKGNDNG